MRQSTLKSLFWSFLEQSGSKAIALLVQIALARLLAPEAFGLLAIMLVLVDVANAIAQSGLGMALIQSPDINDVACSTAFWLSLGLAAVLYTLFFLAAPFMASFYGMSDLALCLRVISLAVPLNAVNSIQRSLLQKDMDFKSIFFSNTSAIALSGIAGIAAAFAGVGVWALVIQSLSQVAVACIAMAFRMTWRPSLVFDVSRARALFSYGWKICVTAVLGVIYTGVSELIIGKAAGAGMLGFYSQGRKWPNAGINVATNALQNVMFPAFSAMQDDMERLRAVIRRALAVSNFVIVPFSLAAAVTAESVVFLLLGERWLPCVPVYQMTCIGACPMMLQLVNLRAYMALGDSGLYLRLQIIKVVASCAVIWAVAVLTGDIYLTALATSLCGIVCVFAVDMQPAKRMHGVSRREQLKVFFPALAVSVAASGAAMALLVLDMPCPLMLAVQIAVFAAVYLVLARAFRIPGTAECAEAVHTLIAREK